MIKNLNILKKLGNGSENILLLFVQIPIAFIFLYSPIGLKFNGDAPWLIFITYSVVISLFYILKVSFNERNLEETFSKSTFFTMGISLILMPKNTTLIELLGVFSVIMSTFFVFYMKSKNQLKKIKEEDLKKHYIKIKDYKLNSNEQNSMWYYLILISSIHYLTLDVSPELTWLTYTSLCYIVLMLALSLIIKFCPISNLRIVGLVVGTYAVQSVCNSADYIKIEMMSPFLIGFIMVTSLFDSIPIILYAINKNKFWKIYGKINKSFANISGRDNVDELKDYFENFEDINKNKGHVWFDTVQHRIVLMTYKSYFFIEKHHYNGQEKTVEVFNENNLNFNKKSLEQLTLWSGSKLSCFTEREHKISEYYSIKQIRDYLTMNDINYTSLTENDFIVIDMMTI